MAVTPYIYDGGILTAAATTQGTAVPALTKRVVKAAALVNNTGAPIAATVNFVTAAAVAYPMITGRAIAAGESYPCPELISQGLNPGSTIQALGAGLVFKYTATDFV